MKTKTRAPRQNKNTRAKKRVEVSLHELARAELVRALNDPLTDAGEPAYFFKHALVQDTAQSTLLHGEYKRLNLLVAQAYEKIYPAHTMNEYAAVLAQHYDAAGDDAKTLQYASRAGDLAARVYANPEAIAFYSQAIAHAQEIPDGHTALRELFSKRGRAWELVGDHAHALANYMEMETTAQTRGDRALQLAALMQRATIHSTPNAKFDAPRAQALSEQSLALARELGDRASEAKILWNLLLLAHFSGQAAKAIAYGEQSIALARELNLQEQLAYSLNDTGRAYFLNNQMTEGLVLLREAQTLWRALDNKPMLADNLNTLATTASTLGQHDTALLYAQEAFQLGRTIHNAWTMAHSQMTRSFIYFECGDVANALTAMQEGLPLAQQVGFQIALETMKMLLALTYADVGDIPRALEIMRPRAKQPEGAWQSNALGVLAQLYVAQGALAEARMTLRASYAALQQGPTNPFVGSTTVLADAELAAAEGDYARALALLDEQFERFASARIRSIHLTALQLKARALQKLGQLDEAVRVANDARTKAEPYDSRRILWRIYAVLSEIENERGNVAQANAYREQARAVLNFIVEHTPQEFRESFLNLPNVRAVTES